MGRQFRFLFGFAIGAVAGWVLGVLYVPQSGQETRGAIEQKAIELKDRAEEAAKDAADSLGEVTITLTD